MHRGYLFVPGFAKCHWRCMRSSLGWRGGFVRVTAPPARLPTPSPARRMGSGVGGVGRAGRAVAAWGWCLGRAWPPWLGAGPVPRCRLAWGADAVESPDRGSDSCSHSRPPAVPLMKTPVLDEFGRPAHLHSSPQCVCVCVCVCVCTCWVMSNSLQPHGL